MQSHYTIPTIGQYPRQESNLICDLRKVTCEPAHSEDIGLEQHPGQESNLDLPFRRGP